MTTKHLSALFCCLTGTATLSAQSTVATVRTATGLTDSALYNLVAQFQQSALDVRFGALVLMGIASIFCICIACASISASPRCTTNTPTTTMPTHKAGPSANTVASGNFVPSHEIT